MSIKVHVEVEKRGDIDIEEWLDERWSLFECEALLDEDSEGYEEGLDAIRSEAEYDLSLSSPDTDVSISIDSEALAQYVASRREKEAVNDAPDRP